MTAKNFLTPIGRMVWGSLYKPQEKDADGKPLTIKNGPQAGQPRVAYNFGLAIPKGPERFWWETTWGVELWSVAVAGNPQAANTAAAEVAAGRDPSRFFAFKVTDGDSTMPNKRGKKPFEQEGYKGHWVLSFGSSFAPRIYNRDGSAPIPEVGAVKCGYYVQVAGTIDYNNSTQNPGVYLNHNMVALQGYGPEISSGPDAAGVGFGAGAAPPGMSMQPPAGLPVSAPPAGAPPMVASPPVAAAPVAPPSPPVVPFTPPVAVAPAPAFLAPPPAPAAPPAAPRPQMTAKAGGGTYEQYIAQGWTDATLRQHGYLV